MTITTFLIMLSSFSVLSGLVTEWIKRVITDKENLSYNILAVVVALAVGGGGTTIYYMLNEIAFDTKNVIFIVLMGLASGLVSMVGFDKVKQAITQITGK